MFPENLKELREQHGYSIPQFVKAYNDIYCTKLNVAKVKRFENGTDDARMIVVENIADFFNVSVDYSFKKIN